MQAGGALRRDRDCYRTGERLGQDDKRPSPREARAHKVFERGIVEIPVSRVGDGDCPDACSKCFTKASKESARSIEPRENQQSRLVSAPEKVAECATDRRSMSLDVFGPHLMISSTKAIGVRCGQRWHTTQHHGVPQRSGSRVGIGGAGSMPPWLPDL